MFVMGMLVNAAMESVKTLVEIYCARILESIFHFILSCPDDIGATR
jgi:hypothetical protein